MGDPGLRPGADMRKLRRLAVDANGTTARPQADKALHQFRPAGADKACKAEYLAFP